MFFKYAPKNCNFSSICRQDWKFVFDVAGKTANWEYSPSPLGIMGDQLKRALNHSKPWSCDVLGFQGVILIGHLWPPRNTQVSRTAVRPIVLIFSVGRERDEKCTWSGIIYLKIYKHIYLKIYIHIYISQNIYINLPQDSFLKTLHRSGLHPTERLTPLGMMWYPLRVLLKPTSTPRYSYTKGLKGAFSWALIMSRIVSLSDTPAWLCIHIMGRISCTRRDFFSKSY